MPVNSYWIDRHFSIKSYSLSSLVVGAVTSFY